MSRTKTTVDTTTYTRSDAERILEDYARAEADLTTLKQKKALEIAKINEKYADTMEALEVEMSDSFDKLQKFAEQNDTMFTSTRSLAFAFGSLGFRKGTPSLKIAVKDITWDNVVERIKRLKATEFLRTKVEVDKRALLAARTDQKVVKLIQKAGLEVEVEETFFVKTNLEG